MRTANVKYMLIVKLKSNMESEREGTSRSVKGGKFVRYSGGAAASRTAQIYMQGILEEEILGAFLAASADKSHILLL